ncbi:MAG: Ku protein [Solirubrobacteraceae bacterium]
MARAIWSGAISFGLVNVPVRLFSATSPKTVRFNQISGKTGARIKQKRVDASTGEEVAFEDIVKGYELGPDRYVVIDPEELDALDPKATHTIDIEEFVDLDQIDPIYYDNSYYVAPSAGGAKAYRLLLEAMRDSAKVAIGRVVLRSKQQLCALRPTGDVLTLSTMLFGDEIVSPDSVDELDGAAEAQASERELAMARQLIDSLSSTFDPARHRDEYRERVLALIEAKAAGEQFAPAPVDEAPAAAPDLMAALEASLAAVRGPSASEAPPAKPRGRARTSKKTPASDGEPVASAPPRRSRTTKKAPAPDGETAASAAGSER